MQHRTVRDVMTPGVVTARPGTPFKEIAGLFERNGVAAVPVVDDRDRPLGVVSEADLLRTQARLPDPQGHSVSLPADSRDSAGTVAETAEGLMTSPAVCARPEWSIVEAARTMDREGIKRLPVVDEAGRLTGIVSRSDLLRLFLRHDTAIREEIARDILDRTLHLAPDAVRVTVRDGVVTLAGRVEEAGLIPVVERLCASVDGVVSVHQAIEHPSTASQAGATAATA
ncbi:CBS domain-containing protein [Kitasatospora herbaricolor]|uniref:CBS domain-containing protein n=1 Tax=Kitasatospora herbaricolor TaxID=68217 RepID=A0ABZ1W2C2_9ACTN|nr:CBS domain-containing protein [Kitasatospora herbaricolor]